MTVAASSTSEFTIGQLCLTAARLAGVINHFQTLQNELAAEMRTLLDLRLKYLETKGLRARAVTFYTLELEPDVGVYTLGDTVLDVIGNAMYIPESEVDPERAMGETLVRQEQRDIWHERSDKGSTGRPVSFFASRVSTLIEVRPWPIPDEAGYLRLQVHRLPANGTDGSATLDLERVWQLCVTHWLASDVAESHNKSTDKIFRLQKRAAEYEQTCRGFSNPRGPTQIYVDHDTGWTR